MARDRARATRTAETEMKSEPEYLGDGVYATCDGSYIWIKTERENGWHMIALEPEVLDALNAYADRLRKAAEMARAMAGDAA